MLLCSFGQMIANKFLFHQKALATCWEVFQSFSSSDISTTRYANLIGKRLLYCRLLGLFIDLSYHYLCASDANLCTYCKNKEVVLERLSNSACMPPVAQENEMLRKRSETRFSRYVQYCIGFRKRIRIRRNIPGSYVPLRCPGQMMSHWDLKTV